MKKAAIATAGAAMTSPLSAMLSNTNMAFLLEKIHNGGSTTPKRDEQQQFMNFIR